LQKRALADVIGAADGEYADVAVLGTVAVDAHTVPMIAGSMYPIARAELRNKRVSYTAADHS
jgi:hypothetical protein